MRFGFRYIFVTLYFYFSSKHFMEDITHRIKRSYCSCIELVFRETIYDALWLEA